MWHCLIGLETDTGSQVCGAITHAIRVYTKVDYAIVSRILSKMKKLTNINLLWQFIRRFSVAISLFKVNNGNTKRRCGVCSNSTTIVPE